MKARTYTLLKKIVSVVTPQQYKSNTFFVNESAIPLPTEYAEGDTSIKFRLFDNNDFPPEARLTSIKVKNSGGIDANGNNFYHFELRVTTPEGTDPMQTDVLTLTPSGNPALESAYEDLFTPAVYGWGNVNGDTLQGYEGFTKELWMVMDSNPTPPITWTGGGILTVELNIEQLSS